MRLVHRLRVGLKGAALSTNPDEVSTAAANTVSGEERSESRESRVRGLSGSSRSPLSGYEVDCL